MASYVTNPDSPSRRQRTTAPPADPLCRTGRPVSRSHSEPGKDLGRYAGRIGSAVRRREALQCGRALDAATLPASTNRRPDTESDQIAGKRLRLCLNEPLSSHCVRLFRSQSACSTGSILLWTCSVNCQGILNPGSSKHGEARRASIGSNCVYRWLPCSAAQTPAAGPRSTLAGIGKLQEGRASPKTGWYSRIQQYLLRRNN